MRKSVFFLATVLFVFPTSLLADIYGTDANGRPVILRDNGTWSYHSNPDENRCRQYAAVAVKQYGLNLSRKCGFAGRLWNANSGYHYNWCVSVGVADTQKGFRDRDNALKRCPTGGGGNAANENRCRQYATNAVQQNKVNLNRKCGFAGRLWTANFTHHYNWCLFAGVADTQQGFRDRDNALKRCPATTTIGGGNGIIVQSATYGDNCGVAIGNVTHHIARACNGKPSCGYTVNYNLIGDPAHGCAKSYEVLYRCGNNPRVFGKSLSAEAGLGDKSVLLQCASTGGLYK